MKGIDLRLTLFLTFVASLAAPSARADFLQVTFDGFTVQDNSALDTTAATGIVEFDSTGTAPFSISSGNNVKGKAEFFSAGSGGLIETVLPGSQGARLTDFTLERPISASGSATTKQPGRSVPIAQQFRSGIRPGAGVPRRTAGVGRTHRAVGVTPTGLRSPVSF